MKYILIFLHASVVTFDLYSQAGNGLYKGLERMSSVDDNGKISYYDAPRKWYHENLLLVDNDSIFIYKVPVEMIGKKKLYSASDGAFFYYYGAVRQTDTGSVVSLTMNNCDYCGKLVKIDSATGFMYPVAKFQTYKLTTSAGSLKIGNVLYNQTTGKDIYFPSRHMFYFDSNSIYRYNPKEQYQLISKGITNFLQTKDLELDNDTLRICIDRFVNDSLVETLTPSKIRMDTTGIVVKYYRKSELQKLTANSNKPIRYIEVRQIIDYWRAAEIYLVYVISLPKSVHHFSQRQFSNLFEYNKIGEDYILDGKLRENDWGLIQQK